MSHCHERDPQDWPCLLGIGHDGPHRFVKPPEAEPLRGPEERMIVHDEPEETPRVGELGARTEPIEGCPCSECQKLRDQRMGSFVDSVLAAGMRLDPRAGLEDTPAGIRPREPVREPNVGLDPWIHRGARMRCQTCMWYVAKVTAMRDDGARQIGRCRKRAPELGGFPAVYPMDWCGDHKMDEEKL